MYPKVLDRYFKCKYLTYKEWKQLEPPDEPELLCDVSTLPIRNGNCTVAANTDTDDK